jgi:type IV pilus biogenesis protein CpaD/CtpE
MDTGLYRVETTGLSGLAGIIGSFSAAPAKTAGKYLPSKLIWLSAVLIVGSGAWMLLSGSASNTTATAEREPVRLATAATSEPAPSPATDTAQDKSSLDPQATPAEAIAPVETSPVDGLRISSQSWRRGGLGSKALVTLTLRNANEYAVKDIEIFCSFARRDGSHLTDRKRVIHDTVNMRSQKTFARMHVGFVNINANQAKCSLVAANPV